MIDDGVKEQLKNLDDRLARVEQFLPSVATKDDLKAERRDLDAVIATLATKADLAAAIAPLATKAELAAAIAPLATKAEMREEGERTRRHMDVVAEHLLDRIGLLYEGHARHTDRLDQHTTRLDAIDSRHDALDRRVTVLETGGAKRKK